MRARILAAAGLLAALISTFGPSLLTAGWALRLSGAVMLAGNLGALLLPERGRDA